MVLGSSKTLANFFSQCAKQCATLCPWNGIKSLSFLCPPLGRSQHVRKSGARAPFGQRKVSDGPQRGSGRSKNLVCGNVPVFHLPYARHHNPLLSVFVSWWTVILFCKSRQFWKLSLWIINQEIAKTYFEFLIKNWSWRILESLVIGIL